MFQIVLENCTSRARWCRNLAIEIYDGFWISQRILKRYHIPYFTLSTLYIHSKIAIDFYLRK